MVDKFKKKGEIATLLTALVLAIIATGIFFGNSLLNKKNITKSNAQTALQSIPVTINVTQYTRDIGFLQLRAFLPSDWGIHSIYSTCNLNNGGNLTTGQYNQTISGTCYLDPIKWQQQGYYVLELRVFADSQLSGGGPATEIPTMLQIVDSYANASQISLAVNFGDQLPTPTPTIVCIPATSSCKTSGGEQVGSGICCAGTVCTPGYINNVYLGSTCEAPTTPTATPTNGGTCTKPGTPTITGSTRTPNGNTTNDKITVQWSTVTGADEYLIYRSLNGSAFGYYDVSNGIETSYIDANVASTDTISYEVMAHKTCGVQGDLSAPYVSAPNQPYTLTITAPTSGQNFKTTDTIQFAGNISGTNAGVTGFVEVKLYPNTSPLPYTPLATVRITTLNLTNGIYPFNGTVGPITTPGSYLLHVATFDYSAGTGIKQTTVPFTITGATNNPTSTATPTPVSCGISCNTNAECAAYNANLICASAVCVAPNGVSCPNVTPNVTNTNTPTPSVTTCPVPATPTGLNVNAAASGAPSITWKTVTGATGYDLRIDKNAKSWPAGLQSCSGKNAEDECLDALTTNNYSYTFQQGVAYDVWVHARNSCGQSSATLVSISSANITPGNITPTNSPTPTCIPRPACLDTNPPTCAPKGQNFCPPKNTTPTKTPTPSPTPKACTVDADCTPATCNTTSHTCNPKPTSTPTNSPTPKPTKTPTPKIATPTSCPTPGSPTKLQVSRTPLTGSDETLDISWQNPSAGLTSVVEMIVNGQKFKLFSGTTPQFVSTKIVISGQINNNIFIRVTLKGAKCSTSSKPMTVSVAKGKKGSTTIAPAISVTKKKLSPVLLAGGGMLLVIIIIVTIVAA